MAVRTLTLPISLPSGEIVAAGVTPEEYMAHYAETHHEWVDGIVVRISPVSGIHDELAAYLRALLMAYFDLNPIGTIRGDPFVMRMESIGRFREPDLQIVLHDNPGQLTDTAMIGPADICIEVVSPESADRDYGSKFVEYEQAGVREYWIIDPARKRCQFNRRNEAGVYMAVLADEAGNYHTPLLPKLMLHVPTLWEEELPGYFAIGHAVEAMFKSD